MFNIIYNLFLSIFMIIFNDSYHASVTCMNIICEAEYVCLIILVPTAMG